MRKGIALIQMLIYMIVVAAVMGVLAPVWSSLHQAVWAASDAVEDLDAAGRFLDEFKADIRRARALEVDAHAAGLRMEDGAWVLYRFGSPDEGVIRQEDEEIRSWELSLQQAAFAVHGALVTVDLELRRRAGGGLRPRLRAQVWARNAAEAR